MSFKSMNISADEKPNPQYVAYSSLPAVTQINLIENHIEEVCALLKNKAPNALWVVAWHEYGITEGPSKFISEETLKIFQDVMKDLTKRYPNLVIVGGTVAVHREKTEKDKSKIIAEVMKRYTNEKDAKEFEETRCNGSQYRNHINLTNEVLKNKSSSFGVVSNTCYIFQNGEIIYIHRKRAPFEETIDYSNRRLANTLYLFASDKTNKITAELTHPAGGKVPVNILICREVNLNFVNEEAQQSLFTLMLGDKNALSPRILQSKAFINVDSVYKPQYIRVKKDNHLPHVHVHQTELFNQSTATLQPLPSIHPVEIPLMALILKAIEIAEPKPDGINYELYNAICDLEDELNRSFGKARGAKFALCASKGLKQGLIHEFLEAGPKTRKIEQQLAETLQEALKIIEENPGQYLNCLFEPAPVATSTAFARVAPGS